MILSGGAFGVEKSSRAVRCVTCLDAISARSENGNIYYQIRKTNGDRSERLNYKRCPLESEQTFTLVLTLHFLQLFCRFKELI